MLLPCSPLILGSVYPLSCCSFSLSVRLVFYLMIYVSFAVSCSTHGRMKRAEVELKMDDYKSQGNTLNGTMSCRDGMSLCLPPSLIIWLCLWLGEFAQKLHGGFLCCAVSNASFKFSSIVYLLCMNMCVWYMCMVHVREGWCALSCACMEARGGLWVSRSFALCLVSRRQGLSPNLALDWPPTNLKRSSCLDTPPRDRVYRCMGGHM